MRRSGEQNLSFFNHLLNSAMENHYSEMVIGDLCKMDLSLLLRISLHRRLMAKQINTNLLPLFVDGLNHKVRGRRLECELCSCCMRWSLRPGVHRGAHHPVFLLPPSCSLSEEGITSISRKCFKSTKYLCLH